MLKRLTYFVVVVSLLLGAACSSNQNTAEPTARATQERLTPASQTAAETTVEPTQEPSATATAVPTETATKTPVPPTTTPSPTPIPTATPTPRPVNHANLGWEGYDGAVRTPFPDEARIIDEILAFNQNNSRLNGVTAEDIRILWYTTDDGTAYWYPYFIIDDALLYIYQLHTDANGDPVLVEIPRFLNIGLLEQLGLIQDLTDVKLIWDDRIGKPVLAIEKQGQVLWYPDETRNILVSYDQDLSSFGIPDKPEPAEEYVLVLSAVYSEDIFLFKYDESATATANIGNPQSGPIYQLANNRWQPLVQRDFFGGGPPLIAYIGYTSAEDGQLYIEEMINTQTGISIESNLSTPLAPAAIRYEPSLDYTFVLAAPVWSPDGKYVAFIAQEEDEFSLAVYDVAAQSWESIAQLPQNIGTFQGPIWSPDNSWLAYGYRTSLSATADTIVTVSFPEREDYYIAQGCNPQWSEQNDELILLFNSNCYVNNIEAVKPDGSTTEIGPFEYRSSIGENIVNYVPDEEAFFVYRTNENGTVELLLKPVNGDEEVLLGTLPPLEDGLYWRYPDLIFSPDRNWILLSQRRVEDHRVVSLYIQNLETKEEYLYEDDLGAYLGNGVTGWTPDSKGIVIGPGSVVYNAITGDVVYGHSFTGLYTGRSPWDNNSGTLYWPDTP